LLAFLNESIAAVVGLSEGGFSDFIPEEPDSSGD
jgi:hypothetical protein